MAVTAENIAIQIHRRAIFPDWSHRNLDIQIQQQQLKGYYSLVHNPKMLDGGRESVSRPI
jgi:hypothetical protein